MEGKIKLKDCYRGENMFELFRFIVSECEDVNAYGVFLFLVDNDYEIRKYQVEEEDVPRVTEKDGKITVKHDNFTETFENVPARLTDVSDMIMRQKCARSTATQKP